MRDAIYIDGDRSTPNNGGDIEETRSEISENESTAGKDVMPKAEFARTTAGKSAGRFHAWTIHCQNKQHALLCQQRIRAAFDADKALGDKSNILLVCCYVEQCPRTQKWHLQGYTALKKKRRLSSIFDKILCVWADGAGSSFVIWPYIKPAIYSAWHNKRYCEKDGEGFTLGEAATWDDEKLKALGNNQGKRTDIEAMAKDFRENPWESKLEKARKFPNQFCNYNRAFDKLLTLERDYQYHSKYAESERKNNMKNYVYWGPSGCGKSHTVEEVVKQIIRDNPHCRVFYKTIQKWWDGYDGEEIVVIDDFRSSMPFSELLNLMDGKPFRREMKGTSICLRANHIFFTTPKAPHMWYRKLMDEDGDAREQLERRIYQLREFTRADNPRYNELVGRRLRKRDRMGFIIEEDEDGAGGSQSSQLVRSPNVAVRRAKRPRIISTTSTTSIIRGHSCMLCDEGLPCYIHGNNLDDNDPFHENWL
jgi:hypothetical protein